MSFYRYDFAVVETVGNAFDPHVEGLGHRHPVVLLLHVLFVLQDVLHLLDVLLLKILLFRVVLLALFYLFYALKEFTVKCVRRVARSMICLLMIFPLSIK